MDVLPEDSMSQQIQSDGGLSTSEDSSTRRNPRSNAATGASAAGVRALSAQLVAFYFRIPVKAFFRTRVERLLELFPHVYLKVVAGPYTPLLRVYSFMLFALMAGGSYQIRLYPLCWLMLGLELCCILRIFKF